MKRITLANIRRALEENRHEVTVDPAVAEPSAPRGREDDRAVSADLHTLDGRVAIVGAGVAGLMTALRLAPRPVVLVSKAPLGAEASTLWAQGGLAAALGPRRQRRSCTRPTRSPPATGSACAKSSNASPAPLPQAIEELARLGVAFDRASDGGFALGLEAAHRRRRIVHAGGDGTGRELMRALVAAARGAPSIRAARRIRGAPARRRGRRGARAARRRAAQGRCCSRRTKW